MATQYMSMEHLRYLLFEVLEVEEVLTTERYQDYDKESLLLFLDSIKDFSDKQLFPCFRKMDEEPAHYKNGKIILIPEMEQILKQGFELGLVSAPFSYDDGGMQMPSFAFTAANFIMGAANNNVPSYFGLLTGSANLILTFGNQALKDKYAARMLTGEWGGTMCLTEPQAGSSLSDVTTSAKPNEDGSYQIEGQKIFISGGDYEYLDNFVHLVLARIEGAPAGTRGISLMVVPKFRLAEDGSLEDNDVITAGDFQKLGQRGFCTTHLSFGEKNNCKGWLVGEANKGLKYMFQMMNEARIGVGRDGVCIATAAYYASLQYANERPQGRRLNKMGKKDAHKGQSLIIEHADVRRMLLLQKAIAEGGLSLVFQASKYHDLAETSEGADKEKYHLLLELITPMVKTYPAEKGLVAVTNGLQVLGGYGFCSEFVLQQYYRDIRIMSLYEGTTGIQSQDLLGRKVTMKGGKAIQLLAAEIQSSIQAAMTYDELKPYAKILGEKLGEAQQVLGHLMSFAMKGDYERFLADATLFMEFFGTITVGWQWLNMATVAKKALVSGQLQQSETFYESKIHTMKFYYKYEMPKTLGLAKTLMDNAVLTIMEEEKAELFV